MKTITTISAAILAAACMSNAPPEMGGRAQADLAEELAGRTAVRTVDCVRQAELRSSRSIDEGTIVFGRGRVVYVNQTRTACPLMSNFTALRTRTITTRLCSGDLITIFEPDSGIEHGTCALGEFTEYRRSG